MDMTRRAVLAGAATAVAAPARAATRVSYWHHFTPPEAKGEAKVADLFGTRNPDLTVVSEAIPQPDFLTKVTAASVSGSLPDTGMVTGFRFNDFVALGALVDLTPAVNGWPGRTAFADAAWGPATRDGKVYAVPSTAFVNWMWYRADYFAEAGIAKPPDTLEEFQEACVKLTDPARNRYGFGLRGGAGGAQYLIETILAYGSPIVQDNRPAMDRAKTLAAVKFYSELFTKYKVTPPSTPNDSYRQVMDGFKTGQTAMVWHHTGSVTEIMPVLGDKAATAIRPRGPAARFAQVEYLYNGVMNPRGRDAGWKWVSYWAEPEAALAFLDETGYFPASQVAAQDPRIVNNKVYDAARQTLAFGSQLPGFVGYDNWSAQIVLPALQAVFVGQSTVEAAVDTMMRGLERTLR